MTSTLGISPVEKLSALHLLSKFDCGENSLNHFLRRYALKNQMADSSQTYVVHRNRLVLGYVTLSFGSVSLNEAPSSIAQGMPPYSVPVMILARWAVDRSEQQKGIGKALLREALVKTVAASEIAGLRAILVDAANDGIAEFYKKIGFVDCPVGPRKLMIPIEVVRESL